MQQNIYFRKEVWDKFSKEFEKSKLINDLLATHYNATPRTINETDKSGRTLTLGDLPDGTKGLTITRPKIIKTVKDIPEIKPKGMFDRSNSKPIPK